MLLMRAYEAGIVLLYILAEAIPILLLVLIAALLIRVLRRRK